MINIETLANRTKVTPDGKYLLLGSGHNLSNRQDLARRFTATRYRTDLVLMRRTVRVETNRRHVIATVQEFFKSHQHEPAKQPDFRWRIISATDSQVGSTAVPLSGFSDSSLQYVNVGQRGFFAVDLENRQAMAFLPDVFLENETRFRHRSPLDILFSMTAASLGLVALSGACVGVQDSAVLIFGPPNSGKTTSTYLAAKQGLDFHGDQVVFLDDDSHTLRAWGDPFPAVFRPQGVEFLPELRQLAHYSWYGELSFFYFDKTPLQPRCARPLIPAAALFLDRRRNCKTLLRELTKEEELLRLRNSMLFREHHRFDKQTAVAFDRLVQKPAYELRYDSDPAIAARFIKEFLQ